MSAIRTFLSLPLNESQHRSIDRLVRPMQQVPQSGMRWSSAQTMHLTLIFMGDVEDRQLPDVCRLAAAAARQTAPFEWSLAGLGAFLNKQRPNIFWVGVREESGELVRLHDILEDAMEELGYRKEPRRYTPHITLGRLKIGRRLDPQVWQLFQKQLDWRGPATAADEVHVMASDLRSDGPAYSLLARCPIGESDSPTSDDGE